MKTLTLAAAPVGTLPMSAAGRRWRPVVLALPSAPSVCSLPGMPAIAGYGSGLAAAGTHVGMSDGTAATVPGTAVLATRVDVAALPFVASIEAATVATGATVVAVADAEQAVAAPKQANNPVNQMRKNDLPRGDRAEAPPS